METNTYLYPAFALAVFALFISSCEKKSLTPISKDTGVETVENLGLNASEARALSNKYFDEAIQKIAGSLQSGWNTNTFTKGGQTMAFTKFTLGNKPADGWSLFISMHGGGGTTKEINDGQWRNQQIMMGNGPNAYKGLKEGLMVVPRAPTDTWNMWFQSPIDSLMEAIIRAAVLYGDVNPNKIYIMGYSAGGDGTFRLASRMADHWAAAAMSAGHPGEITPANLRNIGFALNMGGRDNSFNRAELARQWQSELAELAITDAPGYKNQVTIFENTPHWMSMKDSVAIPFMRSFIRNPYPAKVVWTQNSFGPRRNFYWLGVSEDDLVKENYDNKDKKIIVEIKPGNIIDIVANYTEGLHIYLNDEMVKLDEEIKITHKGTVLFVGKIPRNEKIIHRTAQQRLDRSFVFSAEVLITANKTVTVVKE